MEGTQPSAAGGDGAPTAMVVYYCSRSARPRALPAGLSAGEAGLEVTLQQGLGTWIMDQRSGSSTRALVGEVCCGSNKQHHVRQRGGGWSR